MSNHDHGKRNSAVATSQDPLHNTAAQYSQRQELVHNFGNGHVCETDSRGYANPGGRSPMELVLEASDGFIPLWAADSVLHWRFKESSLSAHSDPEQVRKQVRALFAEAVLAWGKAAPVRFREQEDNWDFQIDVRSTDQCINGGCVLASAFFPDSGRHDLFIYPRMFSQSHKEQVDTLIHEVGHIFGLRHFFAKVSESAWPSEIFGKHDKFTIMNYGELSELTKQDKSDLKNLYKQVWAGSLKDVNGTPIVLMKPYHTVGLAMTQFRFSEATAAGRCECCGR